ncbi:MarR family winged helix-turn-helix transcriptional regulator [Desulfosporosinus sp. BG]|uniref:MarR family winged helix-turn-helix transcriptional regulator n=1 Tax=Desulfosporosinus sp. BG TaxID=1633135 RepID=UPI000855EE73|nr:MarR family winged helix-turn-helix transcriptional regulator [Desulfosporosinus sp. BG]ODA43212.1 Transcriptional regulator, MarR family [Desulfosporosinus sp. BG]
MRIDKKIMGRQPELCTVFYDEMLKPSGLKVTQYSLLNHLRRLGPLTMNELSQAIRLERTTLVRNLKPLEKIGMINIRIENPSHARLVHLTEKGLSTLEMAIPYWNQAQQHLDKILTYEEIRVFKGVLQKLESIG